MFLRGSLHSCGCLDRSCSPFACFKAEKYKKSFWVVFILPNFHNTLPLGRLQCLCMEDWDYGRVTAEPPQSFLPWPWAAAMIRLCGLQFWPKNQEFLCDFFCSKWEYFRTLNYSLSLCTCKLLRRRKLSVYCSLSHFHMTFYWRPKHFFSRVLDSTFFFN